ncbi:hypothetical protein MPER_11427 [Moniliophthora perniciosa FA553]|nr:hypothetical protein MPER_11427 [Moniliophthora perniciosa FA553]
MIRFNRRKRPWREEEKGSRNKSNHTHRFITANGALPFRQLSLSTFRFSLFSLSNFFRGVTLDFLATVTVDLLCEGADVDDDLSVDIRAATATDDFGLDADRGVFAMTVVDVCMEERQSAGVPADGMAFLGSAGLAVFLDFRGVDDVDDNDDNDDDDDDDGDAMADAILDFCVGNDERHRLGTDASGDTGGHSSITQD